jgi:PHD/YefM family antitoxin component YafN of YafNO toxin-antitoxin module
MPTLTASEARANLYRLMDQAAESHQPIVITGNATNEDRHLSANARRAAAPARSACRR